MKKIIVILSLISLLAACGDNQSSNADNSSNNNSSNSESAKKKENLLACSVLTEDYINSAYKGATIEHLKELGQSHPMCAGRFEFEGLEYDFSLVLGVIGEADESYLESSVSYFKEKGRIESITGAGEKAYNRNGGADQVSALSNGNLIHVSAYKANKYDLELTKKLANDMFKILD